MTNLYVHEQIITEWQTKQIIRNECTDPEPLTNLILKVVQKHRILDKWRSSILIVLFKKKHNMLSSKLKLTTTFKINATAHTEEEEGFSSGRSCNHAVFVKGHI